jgi:hypothetical protein
MRCNSIERLLSTQSSICLQRPATSVHSDDLEVAGPPYVFYGNLKRNDWRAHLLFSAHICCRTQAELNCWSRWSPGPLYWDVAIFTLGLWTVISHWASRSALGSS